MRKLFNYFIPVLVLMLIIFLSLDIKNLDAYRINKPVNQFDAVEFASTIWNNQLQSIKNSDNLVLITSLLITNPETAFEKYAHKLGISKTWYFMATGQGVIESVEDEYIVVLVENQYKFRIATDFIFGNAVRDGSGLVNIDDFVNMTDFNNVSVELNKLIKTNVVSLLKKNAVVGKQIVFTGAFEINEKNIHPEEILIIPVNVSTHG